MVKPLIIAHRGASGDAPENTLAAFRLAIEQGADLIELDIHQTLDGSLVVLHDESLERTGGDPRLVKDLTLAQIKKLDVGAWRGNTFANEAIPTLAEVLELAEGEISLQIEIKRGHSYYPLIEQRLLETLAPYREKTAVCISSFDTSASNSLYPGPHT